MNAHTDRHINITCWRLPCSTRPPCDASHIGGIHGTCTELHLQVAYPCQSIPQSVDPIRNFPQNSWVWQCGRFILFYFWVILSFVFINSLFLHNNILMLITGGINKVCVCFRDECAFIVNGSHGEEQRPCTEWYFDNSSFASTITSEVWLCLFDRAGQEHWYVHSSA